MPFTKDVYKDLHKSLNETTYWTMVWIVQEVVLPQRWSILCGDEIVNGDRLIDFFFKNPNLRSWKAYNIVDARRMGGDSPLIPLLCRFSELRSTYAVDKIRALFALCSDNTGKIDSLLELFADELEDFGKIPDCSNHITQLYYEVIRLASSRERLAQKWALDACWNLVARVLGVPLQQTSMGTQQLKILFETRDRTSRPPPTSFHLEMSLGSVSNTPNWVPQSSSAPLGFTCAFNSTRGFDGNQMNFTALPGPAQAQPPDMRFSSFTNVPSWSNL